MIRIAITEAAYRAIRSTLPEDAPLWPLQRSGRLIHIEAAGCRQVNEFGLSSMVNADHVDFL